MISLYNLLVDFHQWLSRISLCITYSSRISGLSTRKSVSIISWRAHSTRPPSRVEEGCAHYFPNWHVEQKPPSRQLTEVGCLAIGRFFGTWLLLCVFKAGSNRIAGPSIQQAMAAPEKEGWISGPQKLPSKPSSMFCNTRYVCINGNINLGNVKHRLQFTWNHVWCLPVTCLGLVWWFFGYFWKLVSSFGFYDQVQLWRKWFQKPQSAQ